MGTCKTPPYHLGSPSILSKTWGALWPMMDPVHFKQCAHGSEALIGRNDGIPLDRYAPSCISVFASLYFVALFPYTFCFAFAMGNLFRLRRNCSYNRRLRQG